MAFKMSPEWDALKPTTKRSYEFAINKLTERYERVAIKDMRRGELLALRDTYRKHPGNSNNIMGFLSRLLNFAVEREMIPSNPARNLPRLKLQAVDRWTDQEIAYVLHQAPEHIRRLVILGLYTGQRRGDLVAMRWDAWDGDGISLTQEKTGRALYVQAHHILKAELLKWSAGRETLTILATKTGKPWLTGTIGVAWDDFKNEERHNNSIRHLKLHGLRVTAATKLAEAGCSERQIGAITGHTSLAMIQHYTRQASQKVEGGAAITKWEQVGTLPGPKVVKLPGKPLK